MPGKIEIYVRIRKVASNLGSERSVTDAFQPRMSRWGWTNVDGDLSSVQKSMPESDEDALNCAREFADNEGLSIEVLDVNSSRGRIKARTKGVKVIPAIVIGKHRIEGSFTPEQLKSKLKDVHALCSKTSKHGAHGEHI